MLGALSKLDEFLLNPQVRTCSAAVPTRSRNNNSENREPTGDRSLGDSCPEAVFSTYHSGNLNDSELEETHHRTYIETPESMRLLNQMRLRPKFWHFFSSIFYTLEQRIEKPLSLVYMVEIKASLMNKNAKPGHHVTD